MANNPTTPKLTNRRPLRSATATLLLATTLGVGFGCQGPMKPPKLTKEEGKLVAELVQLHRLQILQETRPAAADSLRGELQARLDGTTLDQRIRSLGKDPARGAVLLRAVRDSMAAMRRELFQTGAGPEGDSKPRTPQAQPMAPAEGDRDDED